MENKQKLSEEEREKLNQAAQKNQQFINAFGQLTIQKNSLDKQEKEIKDAYSEFQRNVDELKKSLEETYGAGTVDMDSGEFIPHEEG